MFTSNKIKFKNINENDFSSLKRLINNLEDIDISKIEKKLTLILWRAQVFDNEMSGEIVEAIFKKLEKELTFEKALVMIQQIRQNLAPTLQNKVRDKLISFMDLKNRNETLQAVKDNQFEICITLAKLGNINEVSDDVLKKIIALLLDVITYNICNSSVRAQRTLAFETLGEFGAATTPDYRNQCIQGMLEVLEDQYDRRVFHKAILKSFGKIFNAMDDNESLECINKLRKIDTVPSTILLGCAQTLQPKLFCTHLRSDLKFYELPVKKDSGEDLSFKCRYN